MGGGGRQLDVLIVSLGSTAGLTLADDALAGSLRRAGAEVELARVTAPRPVRTLMLTDLAWARAARSATLEALGSCSPRAIVYSTTTAALLWPRPGAIRFDAPAAGNRPGRHGLWQRPLERRRLRESPLLLPYSEGALREAGAAVEHRPALVLPLAVDAIASSDGEREIAAVTYAANPLKKGLDRVLAAWRAARGAGDELLVAGASPGQLLAAGIDLQAEPGVRNVGPMPAREFRELLGRARVFVCAPRREDYGAAQLEALAEGCLLATTPAPGPYAALPIARQLDERLVDEDLARALARALAHPDRPGYTRRARQALMPFRSVEVDRTVAERVMPRLLA